MQGQMETRALKCPNCGANVPENIARCSYCRSVLTVTACPSCFGAVFKGMKYCPDCGTPIEREPDESDRKRSCPRCGEILTPARTGSVRINECGSCGGIWLEKTVFDKVIENKEKQEQILVYPGPGPAKATESARAGRFYIPCPDCGSLMQRRNFLGISGIVVDWCKDHGTWFDRLELQQIVQFIQSGGLQKARKKEMADLEAEERRLQDMRREFEMEKMNEVHESTSQNLVQGTSLIGFIFSALRKLF